MERYKIEWIPVKNLSVVWVQSQRAYNEKWAKEIADNLDPEKFDPLIVTKPNGHGIYHIIEGQHRRGALEIYAGNDAECAPCRVIDDADPARAAEIWLGVNAGRKAIKPIVAFTVSVTAERDVEVAINRVITRCGYKVSAVKQQYNIAAVSALRTIYNRHGISTVDKTLRTLSTVWGGDTAAVSSAILRGFAIFLNEFSEHVSVKRLKQQVGDRFTPANFQEAATVRKRTTLEKVDEAISELLLREYNRGLKDSQRLHHKKV